jgi:hypothetical protein
MRGGSRCGASVSGMKNEGSGLTAGIVEYGRSLTAGIVEYGRGIRLNAMLN